jgi:hypothetical protein
MSLAQDLEAARIRARAQVDAAQTMGKAKRKRGLFQTLGTIGGGILGAMGGGPMGAAIGSQLGSTLGGELSGVNPAVGTTQGAQTTQNLFGLGSQLASFGFNKPQIPNLGSQNIQPFSQQMEQRSIAPQPNIPGQDVRRYMGGGL